MAPIAKIPVGMIGAWGSPVIVGTAEIQDPNNIHITLDDHELVEEFYDLSEQELVITVSFNYTTKPK